MLVVERDEVGPDVVEIIGIEIDPKDASGVGAGGRNRTDTTEGRGILSAVRLPVPPHPRRQACKTF